MDKAKAIATLFLSISLPCFSSEPTKYYTCSSTSIIQHDSADAKDFSGDLNYFYVIRENDHRLAEISVTGVPKWLGISERKYKDGEWHRLDLDFNIPGVEFTFNEESQRFTIANTTGYLTLDPNFTVKIILGTCDLSSEAQFNSLFSN